MCYEGKTISKDVLKNRKAKNSIMNKEKENLEYF